MNKVMIMIAAATLATSIPALAAEHGKGHDENCIKECQMLVRNCQQEVDSIQQKISKLKQEIGRGTAVYTADELQTLQRKLQDTKKDLETITMGG